MNPIKLECIRLAIQAGAKEELIPVAKEIEAFISLENFDARSPQKGTRRKGQGLKRDLS